MAKHYVVFDGKVPGIYPTWAECQKQTKGVKGAKFKSFENLEAAQKAYNAHKHQEELTDEQIKNSLSTDASCLGSPGITEFRVVDTGTEEEVYRSEVFPLGTNNIGEFLALVEAMKYLDKTNQKDKIIFTDSITAMSWVKKKNIKTTMKRSAETDKLFNYVEEAIQWLNTISVEDFSVMKWETHLFGEIKADFGRKTSR